MSTLHLALLAVAAVPTLWVFFLAYVCIDAHWNSLSLEVKIVGGVVVFIGVIIDTGINWTLGLVLGITPDFTFSQKCGRLKRVGGWRSRVASYFCARWLDPFQVGGHCSQ